MTTSAVQGFADVQAERKTLVIACNMIHDEVIHAMHAVGREYPIVWIEEGLHSSIKKLNGAVQEALDNADASGYECVLLSFGACGNMIEGLHTHNFDLIMPNTDDCVSIMLYPHRTAKQTGVFYITRGWLHSNKNAWNDWDHNAERYGEKKANRILSVMLSSYHSMTVVDTGAYPVSDIWTESVKRAETLNLKHGIESGSTLWLQQLFTGPWDENFLQFGRNETIHVDIFEGGA
ncbi:MAG: DUF1638 domain-containing protein [Clostridiales Family XIII bacterium]|jgi:hypothetical protein|nr:DUF1638 domain-containing protein [Clostridiales Family XIII bacterium]